MKMKKLRSILTDANLIRKHISDKIKDSSLSAYSGQSAYMLMLSFFPFIMFLMALLKYTPLSQDLLSSSVDVIIPGSFHQLISDLIEEIFQNQSHTLVPITVIVALWLGSKSFLSLIRGFNAVYEIEETRNYFIVRFFSILYTIVFAVLIVALLAVLVFGNTLYLNLKNFFPIPESTFLSIISLRAIISFVLMLFFFTLLYKNIPNRKLRFMDQFPGALLATTGWLGFSYLYSYYVDHISNYTSFYGTMTVIALLMIWLYACMYILFLGGLLNYLLQENRISDYLSYLRQK